MILPPSNLGPMSEPWARAITEQTLQNATEVDRLGGDSTNDGRINNSTMDQMALQIKELNQRQAQIISEAPMVTATFNESSPTQTVTRTIQLPRPDDARRHAWISVSSTPGVTPALDVATFVTYIIDGRIFYRASAGLPQGIGTPAGWEGATFSGSTGFTADPGSGGELTIIFQAIAESFGSPGNRVCRLSAIEATIQYAQKV